MKRLHAYPTRERLRELLNYDEHTNGLYWREWKRGRKKNLDAACLTQGRRMIKIDGVMFAETELIAIYRRDKL